jgi:hypothetical protein
MGTTTAQRAVRMFLSLEILTEWLVNGVNTPFKQYGSVIPPDAVVTWVAMTPEFNDRCEIWLQHPSFEAVPEGCVPPVVSPMYAKLIRTT